MAQLLLVLTVAVVIVVMFIYAMAAVKDQKRKNEKIKAHKLRDLMRSTILRDLYHTWQSREDTGLNYYILRDVVLAELRFSKDALPIENEIDPNQSIFQDVYSALKFEKLIDIDEDAKDDRLVILTDAGINYYEKIFGGQDED